MLLYGVLIVVLLGGGSSAYLFRNKLKALWPSLKAKLFSFVKKEEQKMTITTPPAQNPVVTPAVTSSADVAQK